RAVGDVRREGDVALPLLLLVAHARAVAALVRAVEAGDVAELTADAPVLVDARDHADVEAEVAAVAVARHRLADELLRRLHALLVEEVAEPLDHVLDDAVAVVHDRGAHLHRRRAERHELGRVAPVADAADAADRDVDV